ncbi:MAG TPA: alanine racemase [Thermomicrobiaceae bacterium]|nr:alanine racemase [Thermomicrobiaceae bacterium]
MEYHEELDTPALVVDEATLRHNVEEMAAFAREYSVAVRPHLKTHKTVEIARMQRAAGATGFTCAKLGEAEALADAGVLDDVLLAYQIVGGHKLRRLLALMERARVAVAVDGLDGAATMAVACRDAGKTLDVMLEVNTGLDRAGVLPGEPALALAREITKMPGLRLRGVMTHEGHVAKAANADELAPIARKAGEDLVGTADLLRAAGIPVETVSVGSTPAAWYTPTVPGVTEMRPGTYVFNDNSAFRFGRIGPEGCSLRILSTVISRPAPDRAVIDAGSKTLAMDPPQFRSGYGYIVEHPDATIVRVSEEHGVVELPPSARDLRVGDRVHVIPNHVCPTVNLQDELFVVRDRGLVDRWEVVARGKVR